MQRLSRGGWIAAVSNLEHSQLVLGSGTGLGVAVSGYSGQSEAHTVSAARVGWSKAAGSPPDRTLD